MSDAVSRRKFLKRSVAASAAPALALSFEERALLAAAQETPASAAPAAAPGSFPQGTIGKLKVSRLICGGNLISGHAHSRDLIYVSPLLKHYFTDEKVYATLALCEEKGINTAILRVDSQIFRIISTYWDERGGTIQWIAQAKPTEKDLKSDIQRSVDAGAAAVYVHGGVGDRWVGEGRVDLLGKALDIIRDNGVPCGLAGHSIETIKASEKAQLDPDFYMKTLNAKNYWSAGPEPRRDSVWAETPAETIATMATIKKPWIAYKILGAGAIHPKEGFQYAYENGADFACVGMFDFQVTEDVIIGKRVLTQLKDRQRPWMA
jgi:hypothetical protein